MSGSEVLWCDGCKTRACCSPFSQTVRLFACSVFKVIKTPKIKMVCTSSPQPWGRCRSIRSATETDTKTHTENIRKHFSFIKDSHVGNWNNVNNYTRFISRETNSSFGRNKQSDHTIRGWAPWKKRASHITDEHRRAGQSRLSWDTFFFCEEGIMSFQFIIRAFRD